MKGGGAVVIIGSTASIQPPSGMSMYGGAKAALRNMVRAWIQEVKGTGIRINVLSPGAVDAESLRVALADTYGWDQVDAHVAKMAPGPKAAGPQADRAPRRPGPKATGPQGDRDRCQRPRIAGMISSP